MSSFDVGYDVQGGWGTVVSNGGPYTVSILPNIYEDPQAPAQGPAFEGPRVTDPTISLSLFGSPIPITYGVRRLYGQWVEVGPLIRENSDGEVPRYFLNGRISLGVAGLPLPSRRVSRIWINGKVVYSATQDGVVDTMEGLKFRYYPGGPNQQRDPLMVEIFGEDEAVPYRHLMTMVFDRLPLERFGNGQSLPTISVQFLDQSEGTPTANAYGYNSAVYEDSLPLVDWAGGVWYGIVADSPRSLVQFSLSSRAEVYRLPITTSADVTPGGISQNSEVGTFVPWLGMVATFGGTTAPSKARVLLIEPFSAQVVAASGEWGNSNGSPVHIVPVPVVTALGQVETYFLVNDAFYGKFAVLQYVDEEFSTILDANYASTFALAPGRQEADISYAYMSAGSTIYEIEIEGGGTVTVNSVYTAPDTVQFLHYDTADGGLTILYGLNLLKKVSTTDWTTEIWTQTLATTEQVTSRPPSMQRIISNLGFLTSSETFIVELSTGLTEEIGAGAGLYTARDVYDDASKTFILGDQLGAAKQFLPYAYTTSRTALRDILEAMAEDAGYAAADTDFSEVTEDVDGLVVQETISFNVVAEDIARAFGYYITDTDKIRMRKTPTDDDFAVDVALTDDDLIDTPENDGFKALELDRTQENDLPQRVEFTYLDAELNYRWATIPVRRMLYPVPVTVSQDVDRIRLPIVMTASEAAERGARYLARRWRALARGAAVLNFKRIYLEPGDIISVSANGVTRSMRIAEVVVDPAAQGVQVVAETVLEKENMVVPGDGGTAPPPRTFGDNASTYIHLDIPLFRPGHDTGGVSMVQYWMAASTRGQDGWDGANAYSSETGASWEFMGAQGTDPVIGVCTDALGDTALPFQTDYTNSFTMRLRSGDAAELVSVTHAQMVNGSNLCAVGKPGRWELLRYENVTDNLDGTYTFDTFARGVKGTEVYTGTHAAGDLFVLLKTEYLRLTQFETGFLDAVFQFKAVGTGIVFSTVPSVPRTLTGAAETCYAPALLNASINGSDIDLSWVRRTRLNGEWLDGTDTVPLGESSESYSIDIMDGTTVKRTLSATTNTKKYLAADITTDFGSMPASLKFRVYQISAFTNRGHRAEATITL